MNSTSLDANRHEPDTLNTVPAEATGELGSSQSLEADSGLAPRFGARKPFWWALLATILISSIGGFAIYLIHSTTPATNNLASLGGKEPAKPKTAAAGGTSDAKNASSQSSTLPLVGGGSTPGGPMNQNSVAITPANKTAVNASATGSVGAPDASQHTSALPPTGKNDPSTTNNTAYANLPIPNPSTVQRNATNPPLNPGASIEPGGSLKWSKTDAPVKKLAEPGHAGQTGQSQEPDGIGSFPPKPSLAVKSAPGVSPQIAKSQSPTAQASPPVAQASMAASPASPAKQPSGRLRAAQDGQCADANFFSRLVCDERVRLRFCRDRWNEHPDCTVQSSARDL